MKLEDLTKVKKSLLYKDIKISFENYNRKKCDEILTDFNLNNRKLSQTRGEYFAQLINEKQFIEDGNPIKFDKNGDLLDGQHRLLGVSLSGKSMKLLTVKGLEPEVFVTIDDYKVRNFEEVLRIMDVKEYCNMSTIIKHKYLFKYSKDFQQTGKIYFINPIPLIKFMNNEIEIDPIYEQLKWILNLQRENNMLGAGIATFCFNVFSQIDHKKAEDFFIKFYEGHGLEKNDAILKARQFFIKMKNDRYKIGRGIIVKALFYTWNLYCQHEQIRHFDVPQNLEIPIAPQRKRRR